MPWTEDGFVYDQKDTNQNSRTETKTRETKSQVRQVEEDQPMANEAVAGIGIAAQRGEVLETGQRVQKNRDVTENAIFNRLRQSPEIISIFQAIIDDVIGPGVTYHYVGREDGDSNGQQAIRKAKQFWERNQETYANSMMDELAVGDKYLYKRRKDEAEVRDAARTVLRNNYKFNYKSSVEIAADMVTDEIKSNTSMFEIEELVQVPAMTVEHEINKYGDITAYRQKIGADEVELPGDQVMHDSFMNLNGKTYGFTPFLSLFTELDMLANAKNHNAQIFNNAGVVNKIFKLPDEGPGDVNFEMVKNTVAKYRQLRNKHRDLVLTGNIEIEDMNGADATMEFRELAEYITNVLIMAWGVPPTRVGTDIGGGGGRGRSTQLSHEGYFKRIKRLQRKHAAFLNEELFEPVFNVHIQFNNPDTKQEIREADRDLRRLDVAKQHIALGLWNKEKTMEYLDINKTQLPDEIDEEELMVRAMEMSGLQDEVLDDETVNGDTAEDAERMDLAEGQREQELENNGSTNDQ